jgi:hypothetical protein
MTASLRFIVTASKRENVHPSCRTTLKNRQKTEKSLLKPSHRPAMSNRTTADRSAG